MRKTLLLIACIFSISVFSQLKVLKYESLVEIGKDNSVGLYKKEDKYTINYQDLNTGNLNTIRSFSFLNINGDVAYLYKLIMDGFVSTPDKNIMLELPNDIIELHYEKNYGQQTMQFIHIINKNRKYIGKTHFLTKKQVEKIFGRFNGKYTLYDRTPEVSFPVNTTSTATSNSREAKKKSRKHL